MRYVDKHLDVWDCFCMKNKQNIDNLERCDQEMLVWTPDAMGGIKLVLVEKI